MREGHRVETLCRHHRRWLFCGGLAVAVSGCVGGGEEVGAAEAELIGGRDAPGLRAVGSLHMRTEDGTVLPFCTATLIAAETVLTARHCAELWDEGYRVWFGVGSEASAPTGSSEAVASTPVPLGDDPGFVGYFRDVAVLHLETPVRGIAPMRVEGPRRPGRPLFVAGMGTEDAAGLEYGSRRIGSIEFVASEGRFYEHAFGSFDAFFEWVTWLNPDAATATSHLATTGLDRAALGLAPLAAGAAEESPSAAEAVSFEELAREVYENTRLIPGYEIYARPSGRIPGQGCFGDSGGPLLEAASPGSYVVRGVVSGGIRSPESVCDYGTVFAALEGETLVAVDAARAWRDPCGNVGQDNRCAGSAVVRCSSFAEGERRLIRSECPSSMTCSAAGTEGPRCVPRSRRPVRPGGASEPPTEPRGV